MILLVVWSVNGNGSALTSKASSRVNFLNDDTYQWTVIVSSFRQIEQGAHMRESLIYLTRKAFLEHAVIELVYMSMRSLPQVFEKGSRPLKCHKKEI